MMMMMMVVMMMMMSTCKHSESLSLMINYTMIIVITCCNHWPAHFSHSLRDLGKHFIHVAEVELPACLGAFLCVCPDCCTWHHHHHYVHDQWQQQKYHQDRLKMKRNSQFQFQNDNMVGSTSVMTMMKLKKVNDKLIKSQMLQKTLENFVNQTSPIMCHVRSPRHGTCGEKYFSKTLSWRLRLQLNSEKGSPGNSKKKDLVQG